ncbi:MAG: Fic family protein [Planctomycetota bacterium]
MPANAGTLVLAIDGLGPERVVRLAGAGRLPRLAALLAGAQRFRVTPHPVRDPTVPWADLASGADATDHGVLAPATVDHGRVRLTGHRDWLKPPIWIDAAKTGTACRVVNWPATHSPPDLLGLTVVSDAWLRSLDRGAPPDPAGLTAGITEHQLRSARVAPDDLPVQAVSAAAAPAIGRIDDELRNIIARAATTLQLAGELTTPAPQASAMFVRLDYILQLAAWCIDAGITDPDLGEIADRAAQAVDAMVGELVDQPGFRSIWLAGATDIRPLPDELTHREMSLGLPFLVHQRSGIWAARVDQPATPSRPVEKTTCIDLNHALRDELGLPSLPSTAETTPPPSAWQPDTILNLSANGAATEAAQRLGLVDDPEDPGVRSACRHARTLALAHQASAAGRDDRAALAWVHAEGVIDRWEVRLATLAALMKAGRWPQAARAAESMQADAPDEPRLIALLERWPETTDRPPPPDAPTRPDQPAAVTLEIDAGSLLIERSAAAVREIERAIEPIVKGAEDIQRKLLDALPTAQDASARLPSVTAVSGRPPDRWAREWVRRHAPVLSGLSRHPERQRALDRPELERWTPELLRELHRHATGTATAGTAWRAIDRPDGLSGNGFDGRPLGSRPTLASADIPAAIQRWCDELNRRRPDRLSTALVTAALAMGDVFGIHPFADGNGRTARAMLAHQLAPYAALSFPALHAGLEAAFDRHRVRYIALAGDLPLPLIASRDTTQGCQAWAELIARLWVESQRQALNDAGLLTSRKRHARLTTPRLD